MICHIKKIYGVLTMISKDSVSLFIHGKTMAHQWGCCGENQGPEPRFPEQTASYSCSPSLPIHPSASHLTERVREREKHRPGTEAQRGTWQWIQALLGSVEQLCLIKCLASKKNGGENGVLHNNPTLRERQQRRKRGMDDEEILIKA